MQKLYYEDVYVENVQSIAVQDVEAVIKLVVKDITIECFADLIIQTDYQQGKRYLVELFLSPLSIKKSDKEKQIRTEKKMSSIPYYFINGQIKDIFYSHGTKYGIIDSGIFISFDVPKNMIINVGDYFEIYGKLEVRKKK